MTLEKPGRQPGAGRLAGDTRRRLRPLRVAATDDALPPGQSRVPAHILAALDAHARHVPWPAIAEAAGVVVGQAMHWPSLYPQAWAATRDRLLQAAQEHFKPLVPYADKALSAALVSPDARTGLAAAQLAYSYVFGQPRRSEERGGPGNLSITYIDQRVLSLIESGQEVPEDPHI